MNTLRSLVLIAALLAAVPFLGGCYNLVHRLPDGVSYRGDRHPADDVRFMADITWTDDSDVRHVEQHVFDAILEIIGGAERFVLVDMFLYNDFQGDPPETTRALSSELTDALIARKRARPEIDIVVISDPVNTVYGGIESEYFDALEAAGIPVVLTRLDRLRDSNPSYSSFWRLLGKPSGTKKGGLLPSPFSDDKVTMLSYLALLNFKANHRKLVIADSDDGLVALLTSANPHDGSSAHGNVGVSFRGPAVADLLESEQAVLAFSGAEPFEVSLPEPRGPQSPTAATVQVVTEGKIREALLEGIESAGKGDEVDVAVFYISDHDVVDALGDARKRGARVRALLDPNKDAFGREKGGIPNRPVAADLRASDVAVRWCDTHGEQCHAKLMLVRYADSTGMLVLGSANFTRRNLQDFNLETDLAIRGPIESPAIRDATIWFERLWNNELGRSYSVDYDVYRDERLRQRFKYNVEERTGLSTF